MRDLDRLRQFHAFGLDRSPLLRCDRSWRANAAVGSLRHGCDCICSWLARAWRNNCRMCAHGTALAANLNWFSGPLRHYAADRRDDAHVTRAAAKIAGELAAHAR